MAVRRFFGRFIADDAGIAMFEFAIIAPMLVFLAFGTFELHRYIDANEKLEMTTFQLGDLITSNRSVSAAQLEGIMDSAEVMMAPYDASKLGIIVTSVIKLPNKPPQSLWQQRNEAAKQSSRVAAGPRQPANIPMTMVDRDQVLVVEIFYPFKTTLGIPIADAFIDSEDLYKVAFTRPRYGALTDEPL